VRKEIIPYNPKLKLLARNLRNHSTLSEILLWNYLKNKQMRGFDFHRQKPIDNYIVDFYCPELKLAIEIDGVTHGDKEKYDEIRIRRLKSLGMNILVFRDSDVKKEMNAVLEKISDWIKEQTHPTPSAGGE
jgi:very-short-patch-repair endonuclease